MIVFAGAKLTDDNSVAGPKKGAPVTSSLKGVSTSFTHTFPPCSLTVRRLKPRG
jgi:hypothetical protein